MKKFTFVIGSQLSALTCIGVGIYLGPDWFGRFGALVVLFGIISEYALIQKEHAQIYSRLKGQGAAQFGGGGIPDISPTKEHQGLAYIAHFVIVVGTLIWGFGDLPQLWG